MKFFTTKILVLFLLLLSAIVLLQSIYDPLYVFKEAKYLVQPYDLRGFIKMLLYLGGYVVTVALLLVVLGIRSNIIFFIFIVFLVIFYGMDLFVQLIGTSHGFSLNELLLTVNEAGEASALISYLDYILYAFLIALALGGLLFVLRKIFYKHRYASKTIVLLAIIIAMLGAYIPFRLVHSIQFSAYPAYTKVPLLFLNYFLHPRVIKKRVLDAKIEPIKRAKYKNIVWFVDESITGSYLSINGYAKDTTPYLNHFNSSSNNMVNFGIVNSVSNCSSPSNLFLRIGLNPKVYGNYEKTVHDLPTIFQYAKRAGYTTWLLDAQAAKDTLQDALTLYDKKDIDHFVTLDTDTLPHLRDETMFSSFRKALDNKGKNFIVFVKFGAHWPYLLSYDTKKSTFKPILDSTIGGMTLENKTKQINTYLNAIKNSTDEFLHKVLDSSDLNNTIIFYTSDHGQNIMENNTHRTHCNTENIVKNEVTVPLFVFTKNAKSLFLLQKEETYSQIQIFPTTLSVLGYSNTLVKKYGKPLTEGYERNEKRKYWITSSGKKDDY